MENKLYLDLLKKSVLNVIYEPLTDGLINGTVHPVLAHTMIGLKRLNNIQFCYENIIKDSIPGALIETGVWRGGATIFMAGLVKAQGEKRKVYVADSFCGLPKPNAEKYPADLGDMHWTYQDLNVSLEEVISNFKSYDLLSQDIIFLKGWFQDTMPTLHEETFSLIRLDGDMYESTWVALENLYPRLSAGGYLIVDDWLLPGAQKAVVDYRNKFDIQGEMCYIDGSSIFWRKA